MLEAAVSGNVAAVNTNQAANSTTPQGTKAQPSKNSSEASYAVGERGGNQTGAPPESAADRAIARKEAQDSQKKSTPSKPERGKVKSLADLKKLNSKNVAPEKLKTNSVEVDDAALLNPKLEAGRPEPKVKSRAKAEVSTAEETFGERLANEVEGTPVTTEPPAEEVAQELEAEPTQEVKADSEEYTPNIKYKAYGEEKEIPEMFRSLMKDSDSEKAVHEVFTKVDAFEKTKARLDAQDQAIKQQILPEINQYRNLKQDFDDLLSRGDIFGVLQKFGVDERKVLQAAADRVNLMEAAPEVRAMHEARVVAEEAQRQSARRLAILEQKDAERERNSRRVSFEQTLAKSEVSAVAQAFDQKMGSPGIFGRMVAQHAHQVYLNSVEQAQMGRGSLVDLTPEQAVQDFMQAYGLKFGENGASQPAASTAQNQPPNASRVSTPVATPSPKPKIIPNIASRSVSSTTTKPVFSSAKDLTKYRIEKFGR